MSEYFINSVKHNDKKELDRVKALLEKEGITLDGNLDYTCAMYDEEYNVIATGSCFGNSLRCFAVSSDHQGEGLLNRIVTHLMEVQMERGNIHLFLYTKEESERFFGDLGFYKIAGVKGVLSFMENRREGFSGYMAALSEYKREGKSGTIVMNANPFTLGHRYLVECAAAACDTLHIFVVSEDSSLVPFSVRKRLVIEGTKDIENVICHDSGSYIISNATFPSYFLKDETSVIENHARLDLSVFARIAPALNITERFVGDEPLSLVTRIYNNIMKEYLPKEGIGCKIIKRKEAGGKVISASSVRECIKNEDWEGLKALVPESTLNYFKSPDAAGVIERIKAAETVVHY